MGNNSRLIINNVGGAKIPDFSSREKVLRNSSC